MAKNDNPFARALGAKSDSKAEGVREAGADLRHRQSDEELQQATNEGGDGNDVPSSVADNADASDAAGGEFGLGNIGFQSAKDRVGDAGELDATGGVDTTTFQDPKTRADQQRSQFDSSGSRPQDQLAAASGDDNTDVSNLATLNPRDFVEQAKGDRNPLNDPLTAAITGLLNEQANSAATSPLSVAEGSDPLGSATQAANTMTEKEKAEFAKSLGVTPPSSGSATPVAPPPAPAPAEDDDDEGGIVNTVVGFLKGLAGKPPEGGGRLSQELAGTDVGGDVGTVPLGVAQDKAGIPNLESELGKVAGGLAGKKGSGAAGSGAGGGTKLTDPDDDRSPPTEGEIAFRQAIEKELGIRRIPGDIDPVDGDGTTGGAPVDDETAAAIVGTKSKNSLVGNPGTAGAGSNPTPTQGNPGLGGGSDHGGDIDFEDGSGFTGGVRTQGPQDVDFNVGSQPLIGIKGKDDDDEDSEDDGGDDDDDDSDDGKD
jgi:hypothetical protein